MCLGEFLKCFLGRMIILLLETMNFFSRVMCMYVFVLGRRIVGKQILGSNDRRNYSVREEQWHGKGMVGD